MQGMSFPVKAIPCFTIINRDGDDLFIVVYAQIVALQTALITKRVELAS